MRREWWFWLGTGVLITLITAVVAFEPTHVLRGFLRREAFFRSRPTSYWREVLREDGQTGYLRQKTVESFTAQPTAVPVLLSCLDDSDSAVRWPAVNLLGRCGVPQHVLPALRERLHDPSIEVRLQAIDALGQMGPDAQPAAADLAELLQDPHAQIRHFADHALWQIDVPTALQAEGWKTFTSQKWQFSAMFPAAPEESQRLIETPNGRVVVYSFGTSHGVTRCMVAVSEYPQDVMEATTEAERLDAMRDWTVTGMGGRLLREETTEQNGYKGREHVIEVEGKGVARTRLFWAGQRLYQVNVTFKREFLNPKAADYFLDSVRFGGDPRKAP
jgi:hypothetical protein